MFCILEKGHMLVAVTAVISLSCNQVYNIKKAKSSRRAYQLQADTHCATGDNNVVLTRVTIEKPSFISVDEAKYLWYKHERAAGLPN